MRSNQALSQIIHEMSTEYKTFTNPTQEEMKQALEEDGVFVIENVLEQEFMDEVKTEIFAAMKVISEGKFDPENKETWQKKNLPPNSRGLFQHYGIGTQKFAVRVRANAKPVFETFYGTEELLTSFDGLSFEPRPRQFRFKSVADWNATQNETLHVDQTSAGFKCMQTGISLEDQGLDSRTFVCIPKSHLRHTEVMNFMCGEEWPSSNWLPLNEKLMEYLGNPKPVRVPLKAGSMVCWDSRTIHASASPCKTLAPESYRLQIFVCMKPIPTDKILYKKEQEKRAKYIAMGRTSRHTPVPIAVFGAAPNSYDGRKFPKLEPYLEMDDAEKKMHGLMPY